MVVNLGLTPVAQWIARRTSNPKVASSSLVRGAIYISMV